MISTKPFVKICGISRLSDAKLAIKLGADAIGFIAYQKSPRYQTPEQVKSICEQLPQNILKVIVTVNSDLKKINQYIKSGINRVQLHGDEDIDYAKQIKIPIWRAIRLHSEEQVTEKFPCEMFVIDSEIEGLYGGTGKVANWKLAQQFVKNHNEPVLIAGGISIYNFKEALQITKAYGIDLSSSLEDKPAIKNHQKINQLFKKIN